MNKMIRGWKGNKDIFVEENLLIFWSTYQTMVKRGEKGEKLKEKRELGQKLLEI